ncbi:MAG TPA: glycoside hydrolase family 16 protein [Phototrophicaceae bacterium]|nr:glycoside hydrolase family 16 protein [Phototrophicaceae bacterium]
MPLKSLALILLLLLSLTAAHTQTADTPETPLFFDDFSYMGTADPAFTGHGWIVRTGKGWPGVPDARWWAKGITIVPDADAADNRLVQLVSTTNGKRTRQTQLCQERKFFEGMYASRVRFSDAPVSGPDGDNIVQTFYQISPLAADLDPDYSELDFEYLPNGGWGTTGPNFFVTTWETFQQEPWIAENQSGQVAASFDGWHTLVLQVADGEVAYYVDGDLLDTHSGEYYPEVPMALNYNLWFIRDGLIDSTEERQYQQQIDWTFYMADTVLTPDEVLAQVAELRAGGVNFTDTIPATELESPCNF